MKFNKKTAAITALTSAVACAIIGSISGTLAWYQYNTRVDVAYAATTAGVSKNLLVRIAPNGLGYNGAANDGWATFLGAKTIYDYLKDHQPTPAANQTKYSQDGTLTPVSFRALGKNDALDLTDATKKPYGNPIAGKNSATDYLPSSNADFVQIPLQFKYVAGEVDTPVTDINAPQGDLSVADKKIYLEEVVIQGTQTGAAALKEDSAAIAKAVRVHVGGNQGNAIFANAANVEGAAYEGSTNVYGNLDLTGDGLLDTTTDFIKNYDRSVSDAEHHAAGQKFVYGENTKVQEFYVAGAASSSQANHSAAIATYKADGVTIDETLSTKSYAQTDASGIAEVTVTIWLEGWTVLDAAHTIESGSSTIAGESITSDIEEDEHSIWTLDTIASVINVGFTFGVAR